MQQRLRVAGTGTFYDADSVQVLVADFSCLASSVVRRFFIVLGVFIDGCAQDCDCGMLG